MQINIKPDGSKTAIMFLTESPRKERTKALKEMRSRVESIGKELGIPVVDQYKYLGAKINNHLSARDAIR